MHFILAACTLLVNAHQTLTVCYAQILQEPAGGINPLPTLKVHPCASFCMSSSPSTAVRVSKAAMAVPRGSVANGIWGVHDCWEVAPNWNSLKYSFRSSLVCSQYLSDGLMEHCPSDSHFVAAVRSNPKWCPKETCCISFPLTPTRCHLLAYTCRMKLFYGEVIFSKCKAGISGGYVWPRSAQRTN